MLPRFIFAAPNITNEKPITPALSLPQLSTTFYSLTPVLLYRLRLWLGIAAARRRDAYAGAIGGNRLTVVKQRDALVLRQVGEVPRILEAKRVRVRDQVADAEPARVGRASINRNCFGQGQPAFVRRGRRKEGGGRREEEGGRRKEGGRRRRRVCALEIHPRKIDAKTTTKEGGEEIRMAKKPIAKK